MFILFFRPQFALHAFILAWFRWHFALCLHYHPALCPPPFIVVLVLGFSSLFPYCFITFHLQLLVLSRLNLTWNRFMVSQCKEGRLSTKMIVISECLGCDLHVDFWINQICYRCEWGALHCCLVCQNQSYFAHNVIILTGFDCVLQCFCMWSIMH